MTEKGSDPALPDGLFTAALETIGREIIDGWHADLPLEPRVSDDAHQRPGGWFYREVVGAVHDGHATQLLKLMCGIVNLVLHLTGLPAQPICAEPS
jgi:hypothetical protein